MKKYKRLNFQLLLCVIQQAQSTAERARSNKAYHNGLEVRKILCCDKIKNTIT